MRPAPAQSALLVADLPFGSYEASDEQAVRTALRFVKDGGADAVKIERAGTSVDRARAVIQAGIPVMGHVGLTPQAATSLGGYRVQGRTADQAEQLIRTLSTCRRPDASPWSWRPYRQPSPSCSCL
jgi:3-methyl-2-oxobutanoate hydroxymethyltransferase